MFKKFKINSSNKFVVGVFGANGNVGRATVAALSYYFSSTISIRAIVRNPLTAKYLADFKGVHIAVGEIGSTGCAKSLEGLTSVFIIPPAVPNRIQLTKVAISLAKECKIGHIVTLSVTVADDLSTEFGREFAELEDHMKSLGTNFTILRMPIFADNFWIIKTTLPKIRLTLDRDKYFTPVVVADIGVAAAFVLAQSNMHANKLYTITSDRITVDMLVGYLSDVLGLQVDYEQMDFEESKRFLVEHDIEPWQIEGTAQLSRLINEGSPLLDQKDSNDFRTITNQEPTKIKDWVTSTKEYFLS